MTLELSTKPALTGAAISKIMNAALAEAVKSDVRVCVSILDDGGHLREMRRMDNVHPGTVEVSAGKARCAVFYRGATAKFADALGGGLQAILSLPGMIPLPGGVPFIVEDTVIGAIGVSGAAPDVDARIAAAGAALLEG